MAISPADVRLAAAAAGAGTARVLAAHANTAWSSNCTGTIAARAASFPCQAAAPTTRLRAANRRQPNAPAPVSSSRTP